MNKPGPADTLRTLNTVQLAQVPHQPWRNGGGSTQELLAWPTSAHWQCRISVARIASNGPFSAFPGVERWFTVLGGEGVVLRFAQRRTMLTAGSEPLRFDGAAAPGCNLLDGATLDLNLMLRRDAGHGAMRVAALDEAWHSEAPLRAVYALGACMLRVDDQAPLQLAADTLAYSDGAAGQTWWLSSPTAAVRAWWLYFKPLHP